MPLPFESVALAIRNGQVATVYVLAGPDGFQQSEVLTSLRGRIPEMGHERLDGAAVSPKDIVGALRTMSFVPGRLVIVDDSPWIVAPKRGEKGDGPGDDQGDDPGAKKPKVVPEQPLLDYLDHPAPGATLVLRTFVAPDKRKRLVKKAAEKGVMLETVAPRDSTAWLRECCHTLGLKLSVEIFTLVASRLQGADCGRMDGELRKLQAYGAGIDRAAVDALLPASHEERIYDLVDAALAGQAAATYQVATALREHGEPVARLLYSLGAQLRTIVQVGAACRGGMGPEAVAAQLGLHPFVTRKARDQGNRLQEPAVAASLEAVWEAEFGFKTGRLDENIALDRALMGILVAVGAVR